MASYRKVKYVVNAISGIWNSFGCIPEEGKSISLTIEDSDVGLSLKSVCKFEESTKDIGRLQENVEISELVVLLPLSRKNFPDVVTEVQEQAVVTDPCEPCPENLCNSEQVAQQAEVTEVTPVMWYCSTEGTWLFRIREALINKILGVPDYKQLTIYEIKDILDNKKTLNDNNSIVRLMKMMVKYNFPPHLNWLLHKYIPPTVMYTAEYKANLSKNDLANIWQGTMPDLAINPVEEEDKTVEHFFTKEEMFSDFKMSDLLKYDIKMKVFKVKKRGEADYYNNLIKDYRPTRNPSINKWYNSNWPYDNFSLIELLKVEFGGIHDHLNDGTSELGVLVPQPEQASNWTDPANIYGPNGDYGFWQMATTWPVYSDLAARQKDWSSPVEQFSKREY